MKQIKRALISVFSKEGIDVIVNKLNDLGVEIYSTGGTYDFITKMGVQAKTVESLTTYPSILGGRVKTLHPKVFGGILGRTDNENDVKQMAEYSIPAFDVVIVDLYPFEKTVESGADHSAIIEKIDIGGISLIRAAAKNYNDVIIVPSVEHYEEFYNLLCDKNGYSDIEDRLQFASYAFMVSSHYDTMIFKYFNKKTSRPENVFKESFVKANALRYGENPHQKGYFYGKFNDMFEQLHGKEISYNNIGDIDAAINLIDDFSDTAFAIIKHNNACGLAVRDTLKDAYLKALEGDPVSAFGGVFVCNRKVDKATAEEMNKIFMEVCIAPDYDKEALDILFSKKNRIILRRKQTDKSDYVFRSALNGVLVQQRDTKVESKEEIVSVTDRQFTAEEVKNLQFANIIVKHTKSNAIVIAKDLQLLGSGTGQTSRVDALSHAIEKAKSFGFDLHGAVMASDAFFPFKDCVTMAHKEGIDAIIQPGGSIRDEESTEYCKGHNMAMAMTGFRHFKH
ncbi:MAG: bifunctional phosphoribosylaminoimidazolecarboxamide formyltransferase/IMP cyclohydrolase [Bacteroidales bacterium]|nr:bifunctional phosphoribosylaminoimidazolecarboxamide formyltransferase/IMP cyclohydrolase [Bacteroidales bacterium]